MDGNRIVFIASAPVSESIEHVIQVNKERFGMECTYVMRGEG